MTARELIDDYGASYAGLSLMVDQLADAQRSSLAPVHAIAHADELPPSG